MADVLLSAPLSVCSGAQFTVRGTRVDCLSPALTVLMDMAGEPITETRGQAKPGRGLGRCGGADRRMMHTAKDVHLKQFLDFLSVKILVKTWKNPESDLF